MYDSLRLKLSELVANLTGVQRSAFSVAVSTALPAQLVTQRFPPDF